MIKYVAPLLYLLFAASSWHFAKGFFPYKPISNDHAKFSEVADGFNLEPSFDRLVFMVIDAWRHDFLFDVDSQMMHTRQMLRNGTGFPFISMAKAPTVTMPRIKALTTGNSPNFLDVVLNLDTSSKGVGLGLQDSWLFQLRNTLGRKLELYGDDTWLRLFPGYFDKHDGTTSFFVTDTVQVDTNVTRHIDPVFIQDKWEVLILHYLGLDHVGHVSGPQSPLMGPKQREMDNVIVQIYEHIRVSDAKRIAKGLKPSLFVITGDHGMNEIGNHGGSSYGETATALLFLSPSFQGRPEGIVKPLRSVQQIDIVATLAGMLGFPIPTNCAGSIIPEMLQTLSPTVSVKALRMNCVRLWSLLKSTSLEPVDCKDYDNTDCLGGLFRQLETDSFNDREKALLFIQHASKKLAHSFSDYRLEDLLPGLLGMIFVSLGLLIMTKFKQSPMSRASQLLGLFYMLSFFSSSFVEEEHEIWYYFLASFLLYCALAPFRGAESRGFLFAACLNRLFYSWNQTGIEHAGYQYDMRTFLQSSGEFFQFFLLVLALAMTLAHLRSRRWLTFLLGSISTALVLLYKAEVLLKIPQLSAFIGHFVSIRHVYTLLFLNLSQSIRTDFSSTLIFTVTILSILLSRTHNAVLFPLLSLQSSMFFDALSVSRSAKDYNQFAFVFIVSASYAAFYVTGNSNSIATIDLSNSYVGLYENEMDLAGVLTYLSTFSGVICVIVTSLISWQKLGGTRPTFNAFALAFHWTNFRIISLAMLSLAVTVFRNHLFIWSVFSPKYLYELVALYGFHSIVALTLVAMGFSDKVYSFFLLWRR